MTKEQITYLMLVEFTFRESPNAMKVVRAEMRKIRQLAIRKSSKGKLKIWRVTQVK